MKIVVASLENVFGTVESDGKGFKYEPADDKRAVGVLKEFIYSAPRELLEKSPDQVLGYLVTTRRGRVWCAKVPDDYQVPADRKWKD